MGENLEMNPYTLSHQQLEILDFFQQERSITSIYSNSDLAKQKLFLGFLKTTLLKGQTIILRAGNNAIKEQLLAVIAKENLSSLCLEIKNESTISGDELNLDFVNDLEYHLESKNLVFIIKRNLPDFKQFVISI